MLFLAKLKNGIKMRRNIFYKIICNISDFFLKKIKKEIRELIITLYEIQVETLHAVVVISCSLQIGICFEKSLYRPVSCNGIQ